MKDKKNDEIHEILKEYNEEIKRHIGALSEDFQGKLSGVAEGVIMLSEKVDGMVDRLDRVENKVDNLENKVDNLENKFDRMEVTLNSHTEMIGTLMEDVSEIKIELKNKVDKKDFFELKQRVLVLES